MSGISDALLFEKNGPIVTLTINRPDMRNPLGEPEDADNFTEAANRINEDRDVRCVILTGAGSAFSAGGNIKAMREKSDAFEGPQIAIADKTYRHRIHRIVRAVWGLEVPVIAAVNGPAIGLGNDVACMCDTRIASDSAKFGVTFLKIGLVPGDGGAWLLPKIIGMARAAELFYTGDVVDAQTAQDWGLVSRVVPHDDLMGEAQKLAAKICNQPPDVLRMTKRLMRAGITGTFDTVMDMSASMQALAHGTEDHMEALDAFFEKRKPEFKGR
ncbi:crotonase/enoyl-CoA hydratase family protein [Tepidicaulis sp.]|uniref:crotonase/enoyl-CoA hydratase family protein n=1 Tax=Tepidicaulis sp. TaxID=1920809 RepID=UPI003B5B2383